MPLCPSPLPLLPLCRYCHFCRFCRFCHYCHYCRFCRPRRSCRYSPNLIPCASGSSVLQFTVLVWRRM
jgi:hypothetical protein